MIISVPAPALGTSTEVRAAMRRWCSHPSERVPTVEVDTNAIEIQRFATRIDMSAKQHVRLCLFHDVLLSRSCGPEKRVSIVNQVLDANEDSWWIPYLFEYFSVPVLLPVRQRLLDI